MTMPTLTNDALRITADSVRPWHRNIVSLRTSQDLFAELVDDPADAEVLMRHELRTKPTHQPQPIVHRPFESADYLDAILHVLEWPYLHPCESRYSRGRFGVWYGADSIDTSIHETAYHFVRNTLASQGARESTTPIVQERRVHSVRCTAYLVDLREATRRDPALIDKDDYTACQALGAQLKHAGQPGVITKSARHDGHDIIAVFTPSVLCDPAMVCYLTYTLDVTKKVVTVERTRGAVEWTINYA